jgi:GNAT superfamily N-acetyltransferase
MRSVDSDLHCLSAGGIHVARLHQTFVDWHNGLPAQRQSLNVEVLRFGCLSIRMTSFHLRPATLDEKPQLELLIARSARELSQGDYSAEQVEGALRGAFGVDTQLIRDRTYFVAEVDGRIVGCGGWSHRKTLFGGDARSDREPGELDPTTDAAKIRAFFVDPDYARRGIGRAILEECERAARAHGFERFEMMATLPGVRLYEACGYEPEERVNYPLGQSLSIAFVRMSKG